LAPGLWFATYAQSDFDGRRLFINFSVLADRFIRSTAIGPPKRGAGGKRAELSKTFPPTAPIESRSSSSYNHMDLTRPNARCVWCALNGRSVMIPVSAFGFYGDLGAGLFVSTIRPSRRFSEHTSCGPAAATAGQRETEKCGPRRLRIQAEYRLWEHRSRSRPQTSPLSACRQPAFVGDVKSQRERERGCKERDGASILKARSIATKME